MPRSTIKIWNYIYETYYILVLIGITHALISMLILGTFTNYGIYNAFLLFISTIVSVYLFNILRAIIYKNPSYSFYHYYMLVIGASIIYAIYAGLSIFQTLMILTISISFTGFFGRLGCYNAGCCHGKQCKKGIVYPNTYKKYELDEKYLNTPLFPTQFLESGSHLFNAVLGVGLLIAQVPEELIFSTTLLSYTLVRSLLEFKRGDLRPTWLGVSEAQWIGALISITLLMIGINNESLKPLLIAMSTVHVCIILFAVYRNQRSIHKAKKLSKNSLNTT